MTATQTTLTTSQLRRQLEELPADVLSDGQGFHIDIVTAVRHYEADPERFHGQTPDNPDGDPVQALILTDGPWWVTDQDDDE